MTRAPTPMYRNIRTWLFEQTHPLSLLVDPMRTVQVCLGDLSHYGYRAFNEGEDCVDQFPFLFGLDFAEAIELKFVETPNGNTAHVQVLPLGGSAQIILYDATEQKSMQVEMQQKANELYLLHQEQTKTMQAMQILEAELEKKNREAEKANQLKSRFIANMSHEFRTPLTGILGFTDLIQQESHSDPIYSEYITAVEHGAKHLLNLVENLLDQAQIETSSVEIHPNKTMLKELFEEIEAGFLTLANSRSIELKLATSALPETVCIDDLRLRQIIVNLVGNAIKFTNHGNVLLSASWTDGILKVSVQDTGCGIAKACQEKIFKAFEKLKNEPGSGLGLSIVKHLVENMDGRIALESSEGRGSRFDVVLPAPKMNSSNSKLPSELSIRREIRISCKILVVEDNPDILQLLHAVLENAGCNIIESIDGNDAINRAFEAQPDLVLMDLNLPGLSGYDAAWKLRSGGFTNPIFALSASTSAEHKRHAIEAGCDEYVIKPFDIPLLLKKIQQFVNPSVRSKAISKRQEELDARFNASFSDKQLRLERAWRAARANQWAATAVVELRQLVHNLSGSAGLYGYSTISDISKQIDNLIYEFTRTGGLISDVEADRLNNLLGELSGLLQNAKAASKLS